MPSSDDEVTTLAPATVKNWTPVRSSRGKFVHLCYDGRNVLCGVRIQTLIAAPDEDIDCHECWFASIYN